MGAAAQRGDRVYQFGSFRLQSNPVLLLHRGEVVSLPPKALSTLLVLVENAGNLVEKQALLDAVWPGTFVEENSLAQNVSRLRRLLEKDGGESGIETVPRRGYRFAGRVLEALPGTPEPAYAPHEQPPRGNQTPKAGAPAQGAPGGGRLRAVTVTVRVVLEELEPPG